jgi:threonylcarbamoyladenosine tRNA methylthiotransferase MtaB
MKNQNVITFGCRLNSFDSQIIKEKANLEKLNNIFFINTCAVTKEAEKQAKKKIRKIKRENPQAKIIVTGCSAQINPRDYKKMKEVDLILGNEEKFKFKKYLNLLNNKSPKIVVNDIMSVKETAGHFIKGFDKKARAFVQIQTGCDHRCTFCIIPFGRGNSRSVPIIKICKQIKILLEKGFKEIVLTGVDLTSYGNDLYGKPKLGNLVKEILKKIKNLERLRLSSIDAIEIDKSLIDIINHDERLMPHLHLSIQSGDNVILKRMKRRHSREDVINLCNNLKKFRNNIVFGADIIAGFPTETNQMFLNSKKILTECDLTYLHIFPYSNRPNTPASKMPQISNKIIKERAKILRVEGFKILQNFLKKQVNKKHKVLFESETEGHSENFVPIKTLIKHKIGEISAVKGKHVVDGKLISQVI